MASRQDANSRSDDPRDHDASLAETTAPEVGKPSLRDEVENTVFQRPDSHVKPDVNASVGDMPVVFGRYRVEKKLGSGAMGAVYLAHDTILRRDVALKTPKFDLVRDKELIKRFYREASAVANLKHPNLCAIYDVGEVLGRHFISMEFVPGKKLQDFIKPNKFIAEKQVMAVVRKIAIGMHEAHMLGVVHRDLKPDNIMVSERGEPVVMDFGLVHQIESGELARITQQGMLIGSPAYMSKEQVEGDLSKLTAATDQYSLGVVLYQLLTSRLPFEGSLHSVLGAILSQEPVPPSHYRPDVNPHLQAVCLKMMSKEPMDRYPSMKAVADAILEVSRGVSQAAGRAAVASVSTDGSVVKGLTETFSDTTQPQNLSGFNFSDFVAKEKLRKTRQKRSRALRFMLLVAGIVACASTVYWSHVVDVPAKNVTAQPLHPLPTTRSTAPGESTSNPSSGFVDLLKETDAERELMKVTESALPPEDAVVFQGKSYKYFPEKLSWHDAQKKCHALGGRLAGVDSRNKNNFLAVLALRFGASGIWLGATDEAKQASWIWEDGSGLAFNNFATGQPLRETPGKNYMMMMLRNSTDAGKWCNQPAVSSQWNPGFICEWDVVAGGKLLTPESTSVQPSASTNLTVVPTPAQPLASARPMETSTSPHPELVRITDTSTTMSSQASAWVSHDGLRMYWEQLDKPDSEYEIWQAERESSEKPFINHRIVGKGRQPTLTPDELEMVFIQLDERPSKRLFTSKRASISDAFGPATELSQFDDSLGFNNPFISADGLALFVTGRSAPSVLTASSFVARRPRLSAPWSVLRPLDIRWDAAKQQAPLTRIAMAPDELSFLATHELEAGQFRVIQSTRELKTEPFEKFEYLTLPGIGHVYGRTPRYCPVTHELYLTAPDDYSNATTLQGWQDSHRPVLWCFRDVDLSQSFAPLVAKSTLPQTELPEAPRANMPVNSLSIQEPKESVAGDWVDLLEWSEGIDWKPLGYDWNEGLR